MRENRTLRSGEPCRHPGCLSHISHSCECCGRVGGRSLRDLLLHERVDVRWYGQNDYLGPYVFEVDLHEGDVFCSQGLIVGSIRDVASWRLHVPKELADL